MKWFILSGEKVRIEMAHPSFSMPDSVLQSFDKTINANQVSENLPDDANRSSVVQALILQWIDENRLHPEGTLPIDEEYDPEDIDNEIILEFLPDVDSRDE